ncbi:helix-turn-helix domain-containing protein [Desulfurococcus amylolyticus]|uniref:helix-turn-helix domain-containing protein n=1 Tax=Desulfurococcus amylolyticus TaxID=94694 RepID=UPI0005B1F670|nr:helix-turn-helix domain-containing protein [Desulfurococcus amylolyticus]
MTSIPEAKKEASMSLHWVSKDVRARLIELMLSTRSIIELSRDLGISPTAIRKYLKREAYPSDEVLQRAVEKLAPYEVDEAMRIIITDLLESLRNLYNSVNEKHKEYIREYLRNITL